MNAYTHAIDAYTHFLRFQLLDVDAVQGMVLLRGGNHDVAARYRLSIETRGGGPWVNRRQAMSIFLDEAERDLSEATRIVMGNGK